MRHITAFSLLLVLGLSGCVTKRDLEEANAKLHRSVITTLSKHEKRREHPYSAWGQVVGIEEDAAPPLNNAGWVKVVRYRIAAINDPRSTEQTNAAAPICVVYSQGFTQGEKVTRVFALGERVALIGDVVKYPWEWAKEGSIDADKARGVEMAPRNPNASP